MTQVMNLSTGELQELLGRYQEAGERLRQSHEKLEVEVSRLSMELEEKNRLLARKTRLELLGEMSAAVAHEIRNPLGGMRLYGALLIRDLEDRPGSKRLVEKILGGMRSLESIVSDLLSFTRGFEPDTRLLEMEDVVEGAIEAAQAQLDQRDIEVRKMCETSPAVVEADGELLKRAFLNVILNAAEAMGKKGTLTVRVGQGVERGRVVRTVSFRDSGPGVSASMRNRLFEPFATDKEGGTGLGLAIVQRIMEAHRGRVETWNAADGGAVFQFSLPEAQRVAGEGVAG